MRAGLSFALATAVWLWGPAPITALETRVESVMTVSVIRAKGRCFRRRIEASGTIAARHSIELRPDRDGLVVSDIFVESGDVAAKGQVLARLVSPRGPLQEGVAVKTPADGTVVSSSAVQGAFAPADGKDPLFRIAEGSDLELRGEVLAVDLPLVKNGMPATLVISGLGEISGKVTSVGSSIDPTTQLGTVSIVITDPRPKVGQFARAEIEAGDDCGLSVPLSALLYGDGTIVGVVRSDRVIMRRVKTGLLDRGDVEIRDGVADDDWVIVRAGPFLREGDLVRSVETSTP